MTPRSLRAPSGTVPVCRVAAGAAVPWRVEISKTSDKRATARGWSVYVVECVDGTLYTGITTDIGRRVQQHNDGVAARYTRSRRPVHLVYTESVTDRGTALRREAAIKRFSAADKRALIAEG